MIIKRLTLFTFSLLLTGYSLASDLYVLNTLGETISYWNGTSVQNDAATLGLYPNDILLKGDTLLALNSGNATLQLLNRFSFAPINTLDLGTGSNPYSMTLTNDERLLVTLWNSNEISVINLRTLTIEDTIPTGNSPQDILYLEGEIFVTSVDFDASTYAYGQGKVYVYDGSTYAELAQINVPTNPQKLLETSDGTLHTLCTGNYWSEFGQVVRISTYSHTTLDTLNVGGSPGDFGQDMDGTVYLSAGGWTAPDSGQVFTYTVAPMELIHGPSNPIYLGQGISNVAIETDVAGAWVSSFSSDQVFSISSTGTINETVTVGDGPGKMVFGSSAPSALIESKQAPDVFHLISNYPNPFNPTTSILFQLSQTTQASLEIFDAQGRWISSLVNEQLSAGSYQKTWSGTNSLGMLQPSGIYFAVLKAGSGQSVIKMNLLK